MAAPLDLKAAIVTGWDLRVLLNSDHISYGEIQTALKEKGIFVSDADKSITVPLLSSTLLTPSEFSKLIENSVDRESQPKIKVCPAFNLISNASDWITPLKEQLFDSSFSLLSAASNVEFVQEPSLTILSPTTISISYKISRHDISKDWIQRELKFDGEITIEKQGSSLKLDFYATHSSKETEAINRKMTARITKVLNEAQVVSQVQEEKITFGSFTNEERVRFFKRLTAGQGKTLKPGKVNDIDLKLDVNGPALPDDPQIAWMKQSVRRLTIDGERLNDIFLIKDEKYYKHYHIQRMDITYPFTESTNTGECRISFSFSDQSRSKTDDAELIFEFPRLSFDVNPNSEGKKLTTSSIQRALRSLVEAKYDLVKTDRLSQATVQV